MAEVRFEQVTKWYTDQAPVINDLNLQVRDSEFLVLVGPSGLREINRAAHDCRVGRHQRR